MNRRKPDPKPNRKGNGNHITPTHREEIIYEAAKLDRMGFSQHDISKRLGVAQPTVSTYLKLVRERYKQKMMLDRDVLVGEKWEQYSDVILEAWKAYIKSKRDAIKLSEEKALRSKFNKVDKHESRKVSRAKPKLEVVSLTTNTEGRYGDPRLLQIICDCLKAQRELKGLDAPKNVQATVVNLDWDLLAGEVTDRNKGQVEDEIKKLLGEPKETNLGIGLLDMDTNGTLIDNPK